MNIIFWHLLREFPVFQTLESVCTMSAASNTLASTAMGTWTWNTLDPVDVGAWTWISLVDSGNGVGWTYWTLDSTGSSRTALVPATEVCWTWKTLPSRVSDWGCSVMPWTVSGGGALGISSTSYAHYWHWYELEWRLTILSTYRRLNFRIQFLNLFVSFLKMLQWFGEKSFWC